MALEAFQVKREHRTHIVKHSSTWSSVPSSCCSPPSVRWSTRLRASSPLTSTASGSSPPRAGWSPAARPPLGMDRRWRPGRRASNRVHFVEPDHAEPQRRRSTPFFCAGGSLPVRRRSLHGTRGRLSIRTRQRSDSYAWTSTRTVDASARSKPVVRPPCAQSRPDCAQL